MYSATCSLPAEVGVGLRFLPCSDHVDAECSYQLTATTRSIVNDAALPLPPSLPHLLWLSAADEYASLLDS